MPSDVLFFTYADRRYAVFALPYAYFALRNNPNAKVEILLEDLDQFTNQYRNGIQHLEDLFPGRSVFTQSTLAINPEIIPNTIRFIEEPTLRCNYIYIGDIDLMVLDDVVRVHEKLMEAHDLPFSNVLRKDRHPPQLSGLHFCRYDDYYPLPDTSDLDTTSRVDENVLYEIMLRKGLMVPKEFDIRPECGIHLSLNRDPLGTTSGPTRENFSPERHLRWGGQPYFGRLLQQISEPAFTSISAHFALEFRALLLMQEAIARGEERKIHRLASAYFVDKRIACSHLPVTRRELFQEISDARDDARHNDAVELARRATMIWPHLPQSWEAYSQALLEAELTALRETATSHLKDLSDGL